MIVFEIVFGLVVFLCSNGFEVKGQIAFECITDCDANQLGVLGAVLINNTCVVHLGALKLNRTASIAYCAATFNGQLATGETKAKWDVIKQLIIQAKAANISDWHHVGLEQDSAAPGHLDGWKWTRTQGNIEIDAAFFQTTSDFKLLNVTSEGHVASQTHGAFKHDDQDEYRFDEVVGHIGYPALCEFETIRPKSMLQEMIYEIAVKCHNELLGQMIGSSCYHAHNTAMSSSLARDTFYDHTTNHTRRLAFFFTDEILQGLLGQGATSMPFGGLLWIGLTNDLTGGVSYWQEKADETAVHGLRVSDRPPVNGGNVTATTECSAASFQVPIKVEKHHVCDSQFWSITETKAHGQRYTLHKNTRFLPDYPMLANKTEGMNDTRRCAFECLTQPGCLAYNLAIQQGICELLPSKLTSIGSQGVLYVDTTDWSYYERIG